MKETNSKRENFNRTETNSKRENFKRTETNSSHEKCRQYWEFCDYDMECMMTIGASSCM